MLQDAHIHLQDVEIAEREGVLRGGVGRLFCNAGAPDDWDAVARLAEERPAVVPFFGIHPWYVHEAIDGWEERLRALLGKHRGGVGEIGLDKLKSCFLDQERIFAAQVEIAISFRRPFVIHCVRAWEPLLESLRKHDLSGQRFMVHAYSGPADTLKELLALGAYISFSARALTVPSDKTLANLRLVPRKRLFLETDFPYLMSKDTPPTAAAYGERIADVYAAASKALSVDVNELERIVWENGTVFTD